MEREHLLIMRFSALGDVAMMVPVVASLAAQYPSLRITVLSRPFARPLFENLAENVGFMAADVKTDYHGIKGLNTLYRRLIAKQFTAIADFHGVLRTAYLRARFNLAQFRVAHINKHRQERRQLVSQKDRRLQPLPTSFQNYCDVLAQLGYPVTLNFRSIFPSGGGNLRLLPAAIGEKKNFQKWIGIAPFAAHEGKVYPLEKMERVLQLLTQRHPSFRIFLFGGGEKEKATMHAWCQRYPQCMTVADALKGLKEELILMSHLDVMISMDSANMHLASLVATPVVSIWGATHPYAGFMGWNQKPENVIQRNDLPCRPCSIFGQKPCLRGDYACLNGITPEQIVERVEKELLEVKK
ncbi:MAG: glycosyltransferase family 9 protein [Prevotellaceae bacterium]|nr:glycosyltransferase family 9 protein [Prevotellaceae bacterium]